MTAATVWSSRRTRRGARRARTIWRDDAIDREMMTTTNRKRLRTRVDLDGMAHFAHTSRGAAGARGDGERLALALGPDILTPTFTWLSMTERSEYTTSEDEYAASLQKEEGIALESPDYAEKMEAFRSRMAKYLQDRLYPNMPDWPVACLYPMSKRRAPGQNWYALDFDTRKKLMAGHARVGRTYAGRVRQLITGSTGLDDEEWFVTLFAHSTSELKSIVYEMRFDEVSAQYAEFGEFLIGIQLPLDTLYARLNL